VIWLVALGDASYSLYLAHPFILRPFRNVWISLVGGRFRWRCMSPWLLCVATFGAVLVYRWVERPLLRWRRPAAAAPAAPPCALSKQAPALP
jgi:exopolysaccharide production protein ExoZ